MIRDSKVIVAALVVALGLAMALVIAGSPAEWSQSNQALKMGDGVELERAEVFRAHNADEGDVRWESLSKPIRKGPFHGSELYRIELERDTPGADLGIVISYPLLTHVTSTTHTKPLQQHQHGFGSASPEHRSQHRVPIIPVEFGDDGVAITDIHVDTEGGHTVPIRVAAMSDIIASENNFLASRVFVYGALTLASIVLLVMGVALGQKFLGVFAALIVLLTLAVATLQGVTMMVFPGLTHAGAKSVIIIGAHSALALLIVFTLKYLPVEQHLPHFLYRSAQGLAVAVAAAIPGSLVAPYSIATAVMMGAAAVSIFTVLGLALQAARHGSVRARWFGAIWLIPLAGVFKYVLELAGVSPFALGVSAVETGLAIALLGVSLLVGITVRAQYQDKLDQQQRLLDYRSQIDLQEQRSATTGLVNRSVFLEKLRQTIERLNRGESEHVIGVVSLHVVGFDNINRTFGHERADGVLKALAERGEGLARNIEGAMMASDYRGESFALAHIEGVTFTAAFYVAGESQVREAAMALLDCFRQPLQKHGMMLEVGARAGYSLYPRPSDCEQSLIRHAFVAMSFDDSDGDGLNAYEERMNEYTDRKITLMGELRQALNDDSGLSLFFQPQIECRSGQLEGVEALIRWEHPTLGMVRPDEFIPMAEETGLIQELTQWVVKNAVKAGKELQGLGVCPRISINVSMRNLRETSFAESLGNILEQYEFDAHQITIEITETSAVREAEKIQGNFLHMNRIGFEISIDDFGTGQTSLAYLKDLPAGEIKIDRSFVMTMAEDRRNASIVRATIALGHDMGYRTVAEGVENEDSVHLLEAMGCDVLQGYHFAKPMDLQSLVRWIKERDERSLKASELVTK